MTRLHHSHQGFHHLHKRIPKTISIPRPEALESIVEQPLSSLNSLFRRSSDDSSDDCSNSSSGKCEKPTDSNNVTLPVALAVIIPILAAIVIFVYLHRKHVKKLRLEDANDPHKSLDFGWDPKQTTKNRRNKSKKGQPEMAITDISNEKGRRPRGMSMDMDLGSPYLLPPGLSGSRESLHSMSRTIHSQDDPYRPATVYTPGDNKSLHSYKTARKVTDDSSSASGSVRPAGRDDMKQDLLGNAESMSKSVPPTTLSSVPQIQAPEAVKEAPRKALSSSPQSGGLSPNFPLLDTPRDSYIDQNGADLRKSNNYLAGFIHSRPQSSDLLSQPSRYATPNEQPSTPASNLQQTPQRKSPPPTINTFEGDTSKSPPPAYTAEASVAPPPRKQSLRASETGQYEHYFDDSSEYGDGVKVTPPSPHGSYPEQQESHRRSSQTYMPAIDEYALGADDHNGLGYDVRRLSMGVRPLPPDDPTDNPEQRANRIRSFYKEYFDDSKPGPVHGGGDYFEDYDQEYLGDGAIFDPASGQFVTGKQPYYPEERGRPYAEPYGRRAMTPPPRASPRYDGRHAATMSGSSRLMPPRSRAFSTASGRFGPSGRIQTKQKLPPPKALNVLPTPHMLKDDSFAIFNSMDFAPPTSAKDRVAGRPESPRGGLRPYSPAVSAHMPLQSSFDDLAAMPSP